MSRPLTLERIVESLHEPVREYAQLIDEIAGASAEAVVIYGAAVDGPFDRAVHTARSVVIVKSVDLEILRRISTHGARLGKLRISAPLIMTTPYIQASCDTFPLEFIEIAQHHAMLFGEDVFGSLTFVDSHVRLQCERELKVLLIGMRQGMLAAAGREKVLGALEIDVADSLIRTLRGMLWLKDSKEDQPTSGIVSAIEQRCDRSLKGVRAALDRSGEHGWAQFHELYEDLEALEGIVNAW
jgi:hypothetical protein